MTRVVVVDDQDMVRTGLRMVLDAEPEIEVVAEAGDGAEAVEVVGRERPDVVLMDIRMPGMDGLKATQLITEAHPGIAVLILTTFDVDEYVYAALRSGASGFLLKDAPADDLVDAIGVVARGEALLAPSVTKRLIAEFAARPDHAEQVDLNGVTEREADVLRLVARGMSNSEIAEELVVAETTVKTHVSRLLMKLGARDRVQLVIAAYESGLVHPGA